MKNEIIKFNSKVYSEASIKEAARQFKKMGIFKLKKGGLYFELSVDIKKCPKNFILDLCNYILYLNVK